MSRAVARVGGIALIPVVMMLAVVASLALVLALAAARKTSDVVRDAEADEAGYLAEAGYHHAATLADGADCRNYPALASTPLGAGSYLASIAPSAGAPVTITATGSVGAAEARVSHTVIPLALAQSADLQPGSSGRDTQIDEDKPWDGDGGDSQMRTGADNGDKRLRALIRFDLSGLAPETEILSARLSLEVSNTNGSTSTVNVHRLTHTWDENQASWFRYDSGLFDYWGSYGGDYDPTPAGSFTASVGRVEVDVTDVVRDWHAGTAANYGLLLKLANENRKVEQTYRTGDEPNIDRRPRLEITHACPCNAVCAVPPAAACDADIVPDTQVGAFSTGALGQHWGIGWVPAGTVVGGATVPGAGGWLLVDESARQLRLADTAGNLLATLTLPGNSPRDAAFIESGAWFGHIAVSDVADERIYLLNANGTLEGSLSTLGISDDPVGLTYIGTTSGGLYDGALAISSDKDAGGAGNATVSILDQSGTLLTAIDVSAYLDKPWGLAHLPGTDKLLVANENGGAYVFTFDGTLTAQYDADARFGDAKVRGAAIDLLSCNHVLGDGDAKLVRSVTVP